MMKVKKLSLFYNSDFNYTFSRYDYNLLYIEVNDKYRITPDIFYGKDCKLKRIYNICRQCFTPDDARFWLVKNYGFGEVLVYVNNELYSKYTLKEYKKSIKETEEKASKSIVKIKKGREKDESNND